MFALMVAAIAGLPVAFYGLFLASVRRPGLLPVALTLLVCVGVVFAYLFANQSPDMFGPFFATGFMLWAGVMGFVARSLIMRLYRREAAFANPAAIFVGGLFFLLAFWPVSRFILPW